MHEEEGRRFKLYGIAAEGERPRDELVEATNGDEIHQRMLSARLDRPSELTDHERRAWLRHVLQHGDLAAYVADTFEDDV